MIRHVAGALLALSSLISGAIAAADEFPFDQELLLGSAPMRPGKRMPILVVEANGHANIDLWCKTVSARVDISGSTIRIEPDPLPEGLPEMLSAGQCTPDRIKADERLLADLAQITAWQRENGGIVLVGPTPLKFRPSDH
jgi:hypothetical protein